VVLFGLSGVRGDDNRCSKLRSLSECLSGCDNSLHHLLLSHHTSAPSSLFNLLTTTIARPQSTGTSSLVWYKVPDLFLGFSQRRHCLSLICVILQATKSRHWWIWLWIIPTQINTAYWFCKLHDKGQFLDVTSSFDCQQRDDTLSSSGIDFSRLVFLLGDTAQQELDWTGHNHYSPHTETLRRKISRSSNSPTSEDDIFPTPGYGQVRKSYSEFLGWITTLFGCATWNKAENEAAEVTLGAGCCKWLGWCTCQVNFHGTSSSRLPARCRILASKYFSVVIVCCGRHHRSPFFRFQ